MRNVHRCFLLSLAMAFLTACTGLTIAPDSRSLSTEELLRAEPLTGPTDVPELEDIDVLALDQDMRDFLNEHVNPNRGYFLKMHDLIYAMISDGTFGLEYDESTRTAEETFHARHGNCLSFTNMFVAMAREVGIDASFQEIEIPPSWSVERGYVHAEPSCEYLHRPWCGLFQGSRLQHRRLAGPL